MNSGAAQLRFAVLHHTGVAEPHFDLLTELSPGAPLATWRLPQWPLRGRTAVQQQPDHRGVYLDYQGPVSGGRGEVQRVAGGSCHILVHQPDFLKLELTWADHHVVLTLKSLGDLQWEASPG
jgi:hypothetical protein